jgi:hypothetical protein
MPLLLEELPLELEEVLAPELEVDEVELLLEEVPPASGAPEVLPELLLGAPMLLELLPLSLAHATTSPTNVARPIGNQVFFMREVYRFIAYVAKISRSYWQV